MAVLKHDRTPIASEEDVVRVRQRVREVALDMHFSLVEQTKIVTAASELARNTLVHGGGGTLRIETLNDGVHKGLRLIFEDRGPGIPDIALAMKEGFTTGNGLGLGLSGAKRLMSDFTIESRIAEGTRVTVTRWR
jgi:serine/threonine-protein kinase RsbT